MFRRLVVRDPPTTVWRPSDTMVSLLRTSTAVLLVLAAGWLIYGQSAQFAFQLLWDDQRYVTENSYVNSGLDLSSFTAAFLFPQTGNWHPLTMLSHALDVSLFGLSPGPHHLVNVGLHVVVALLCCRLLVVCGLAYWAAVGVALLFVVHPLQVESVAWVSERKNLLCAMFWLLSAYWYLRGQRGEGRNTELVAFLFAWAAMLSKPAAVMLPVTLILLDFWPLRRFSPGFRWKDLLRLAWEKHLFFILAAVISTLTVIVQHAAGQTWLQEKTTLVDRLGSAVVAYGHYLGRFVFPGGLHYLYVWERPDWLAEVLPTGVLLVAVTSVLWKLRDQHPPLFFGWAWFLVVPLPTLGLIQVGLQGSADRYMYLPMLGLGIMAVYLLAATLRKTPVLMPAVFVLSATLWALMAYRQAGTWASDETRVARALQVDAMHCPARMLNVYMALQKTDTRDYALRLREAVERDCNEPKYRRHLAGLYGRFPAAAASNASNQNGR